MNTPTPADSPNELDRQLDELIYKDLLDWIPVDMADSAQTDGLVLHLDAIKKLLRRRDAEHEAHLLEVILELTGYDDDDEIVLSVEQIRRAIHAEFAPIKREEGE